MEEFQRMEIETTSGETPIEGPCKRQSKLTSFFQKYVFNHRSKKRYFSMMAKKHQSQNVSALCEKFTKLQMAEGDGSLEVIKYLKAELLQSHQTVTFDAQEVRTKLKDRLNAIQGRTCFSFV